MTEDITTPTGRNSLFDFTTTTTTTAAAHIGPTSPPHKLQKSDTGSSHTQHKRLRRESPGAGTSAIKGITMEGELLVVSGSRMDMTPLPRDFLDAYPYPAFVLVIPIPPANLPESDELPLPPQDHALPFTRSTQYSVQPFDPVWINDKWRNLTQGRKFLDCVDINGARQFGDWISGAKAIRGRTVREERGQQGPAGFWEPENPPYEDRSSSSDHHSSSETGMEASNTHGAMTLVMDLVEPVIVTLELTKTTMPIYQFGALGTRNRMESHTFVIITTTPKSPLSHAALPDAVSDLRISETHTPMLEPTPRTTIMKPLSLNVNITPTDEIMALDLPGNEGGSQNRPLYFNRDGTISRPRAHFNKSKDVNGKSLDVHELLQTTDWSATSLGPMESWPQSLKSIVSLVMAYPHQCCLWWGKDLTLIYNTPYAEMMHKHPDLFGMSGPLGWSEIWSALGPLSELVLSGTPVSKEDDFLLFKQLPHQGSGTFEAYHSWMWVPILQEDGTFGGLWNATIDTTKKVLAERRLASVREMGERTSIARTMQEFDTAVVDILSANPKDVPFAALYHVEVSSEKRSQNGGATKTPNPNSFNRDIPAVQRINLHLAGSIGIPDDHPSTPLDLTLYINPNRHRESRSGLHMTGSPTMSIVSSLSGIPSSLTASADEDMRSHSESWPFRECLQNKRLVLVEDCSALIQGFPIRIWDELPNGAVVIPISNDSDEGLPSAVLVVGLSIRRPFDDDYESFVHVLRLQLASGITAVKSYEAERQRIDELAALDRAKSLLFSNVSHELRTPLTLVAGPLDDLLQETKDGPKREMLVMARRNVRRLTRLVSTLMDVSRLEAGRLKGSFRLVNLGLVTRDLAALFRGAIERAKLRFVVECDLTPRTVFVDPDHWEKIMFNLIGNALKYTLSGFVHVNLTYNSSEAILSVKDSGVGIPHSDLGLIGERFHRVQSVSRSHEGTGIGLALIKELIKLHGGVMEIDSVIASESIDGSHGSTFRVKIPLGYDHLPRDAIEVGSASGITRNTAYGQGIVDEAMQWNRDREGSSVDSASDSGLTNGESSAGSSRGLDPSTLYFKKEDVILLVDDSFDTRRYMRSIFAPFCSVLEARDGQEALEMVHQQAPDLIITDVMMPKLDGFGLLTALKTSKEWEIIPVIMLTARGGEEYKVEGLLAGADDYLAKPFNARELIARAHMQLQLGKKRRQLESAFDERTAELRTLSELPPLGIFRTTDDGTVTYANTAWYEMTGYPLGEDVTNWGDYIHDGHRDDVFAWWSNVLKSDVQVQTTEFQYANGRWVFCKIVRLEGAARGLSGILGCVMDITERKLSEEIQRTRMLEAEQRRVEAEEAKRQQELLIDITSHEIRNPISSLMQCSSLVKTNLLALQEQLEMALRSRSGFEPTKQLLTTIEEDLEALESIYQCGLAQERISNDVLSLGRIQLDMLQMFDVETDIRNEAQKLISIFQNEARMKRISLSLALGESLERLGVKTIKTDPVRLGQVVTNLLSNGIRFTSTSLIRRIELKYDISFEPPEDNSCLPPRLPDLGSRGPVKEDQPIFLYASVTDTGPGMTEKELELLFQRFSQVSPKTHTIFGGSGLGLFVCRKITEIMGGRIEVTSEHGKGSTFRFFIQARAGAPPKPSPSSTEKATRPSLRKRNTGPKFGIHGPKPHVLIVEDNLINQTVLSRQLRHVGLTCEVANNGLEALEKIRKVTTAGQAPVGTPFDCVLMDLEMPVMDGLTAVRHIRAEEAAGLLSLSLVIALTGNARQGQIDEAKAAGMDEVVIKPYKLDDLLQKIEAMVRIRAANQPRSAVTTPVNEMTENPLASPSAQSRPNLKRMQTGELKELSPPKTEAMKIDEE